MKVSGTYTLAAPRQQVWEALQDPSVLARTIPGCEALEVTGDDAYAATVTAGVASVKGTYQGQVQLRDKQVPSSYRLQAEGAGAPGTIRADALIRLEDHDGDRTRVTFDADAVIGGMIGGVGQRMLAGVAKKTAGEFFAAVERELLGVPAEVAAEVPAAAPAAPAAPAVAAAGEAPAAAAPVVGQVFRGAPRPAAAAPSRLTELLAAFGLGALVAIVGVIVGRRMRP
ncbi:carbon monoxide dehydrogenase subunit G [Egicoccus sp. AB-alg2]|uniref:SRPBCC family protein n=1 Tax=Egicoccus sp. AB-alg2 TaxID=3242693 RepID=UPI00359CC64A